MLIFWLQSSDLLHPHGWRVGTPAKSYGCSGRVRAEERIFEVTRSHPPSRVVTAYFRVSGFVLLFFTPPPYFLALCLQKSQ